MFASPELVAPAYAEMLEPLIEQLERGRDAASSTTSIRPPTRSRFTAWYGRVPNGNGRQANAIAREVRERILRFCLRGLGVAGADPRSLVTERAH